MRSFLTLSVLSLTCGVAHAAIIPLQNGTATFTQSGWSAAQVIDGTGTTYGTAVNGWAISAGGSGPAATDDQVWVAETVADAGSPGGTTLTFSLYQMFNANAPTNVYNLTIGRFRLSATTDARGDFADGLNSGGDVTATWTVLDPISASGTNGRVLTEQGDNSILVTSSGPNTVDEAGRTSVYTVVATTLLTNITGFRLEVIEDASLPNDGPGFNTDPPSDGNFVLSELTVDAVPLPEPASLSLLGIGAVMMLRRRK